MQYDLLIVGAGQAGLTLGYYLRDTHLTYRILEKKTRIGDSWRKRYDSLRLFTPRAYSTLPGLAFPGNPDTCPTKDEMAQYLESYAKHFNLPVQLKTPVEKIEKDGESFTIRSKSYRYHTKAVVVATGAFQTPFIPEVAQQLSPHVFQMHSSAYTNHSVIPKGTTLVVGTGNSGVQIAVELAKSRNVLLASGHNPHILPDKFLGKSIFWWMDKMGLWQLFLKTPQQTLLGKYFLKQQANVIIGIEIKRQIKDGTVIRTPQVVACSSNQITFADTSSIYVDVVIWATGFKQDFRWITLPGVVDATGKPVHNRGITNISGFYFLGLPDFYSGGSAHVAGIQYDAQFLAEYIMYELRDR